MARFEPSRPRSTHSEKSSKNGRFRAPPRNAAATPWSLRFPQWNRGTSVTKTATIDEVIAQLERRTYDVIIVDIHENAPDPVTWLQSIVAKTSPPARRIVYTDKLRPNIEATVISHVLVKRYPFDQLAEAVYAQRSTLLRYTRPGASHFLEPTFCNLGNGMDGCCP